MRHIVAIIPARGGSKGIPGKNLLQFCGLPLIAWSIIQARECSLIDSVWVSSDSDEILAVAESFGAKPIKRPADISGDRASSESAWIHAVKSIEEMHKSIDLVVGMQATSPIRESLDLQNAIFDYETKSLDSLLTVTEIEDHFVWGLENGVAISKNYDYQTRKPRQLLEKRYLENGSFYIFRPDILRESKNRLAGRIGFYVMDKYKSFQIDSQSDVMLCESIMRGYGVDKRE